MSKNIVLAECILFLCLSKFAGSQEDMYICALTASDSLFQKIIEMENWKIMNIKYIIAENVRLYRKNENLTQMELAERAAYL